VVFFFAEGCALLKQRLILYTVADAGCSSLQCPSCQHSDSRVLESRSAESGRSVRRRRECLQCEHRFTTYERVETMPIVVIKRNGNREVFNRSKLLYGLLRASEKTGLDPARIELLVDDIELLLQQRQHRDISSQELGDLVLQQLRLLNEVAYVRFASVYGQFRGVGDFMATLASLQQDGSTPTELAGIG
jgi:transcriptional repressor NrdR